MYEVKTYRRCVMAMKNDAKFEEELTCPFKIKMSFNDFWPKTQKSQKFVLCLAPFEQSI